MRSKKLDRYGISLISITILLCTTIAGFIAPISLNTNAETHLNYPIDNIRSSAAWSSPEILSDSTNNSAWRPVIAGDAQGNLYAVWVDNSGLDYGEGIDADIYFRCWNFSTRTWSAIELVANESAGVSNNPTLALDQFKNVHVAWQDNSSILGAGTDYDIFYKVRNASTGLWGRTELVSSESTQDSAHPTLVVDSIGNIHVAWDDLTNFGGHTDSALDVFYKIKNSTLSTWKNTTIISSDNTRTASEPSLFLDSAGILHIVYCDTYQVYIGTYGLMVSYRTKPVNSGIWSAKLKITGHSAADMYQAWSPKIHVDNAGNRYITFYEYSAIPPFGQGVGLYSKRYNNATNIWESSYLVYNAAPGDWGILFDVDLDTARNLHVVISLNGFIKYRMFNGTSKVWSALNNIVESPVGDSNAPSVVASINGYLNLAWDNNSYSSGYDSPDGGCNSRIYFSNTRPPPPTASFTMNVTFPQPWIPIQFTFTGNPGLEPSTFEWNFGDGSPVSSERDPVHAYNTTGNYNVSLSVIDANLESDMQNQTIHVAVNQAPAPDFSAVSTTITEGGSVQFVDLSSDIDGAIVAWEWDFGDGSTNSTEHEPAYVYQSNGSYTVTLAVTDDLGSISYMQKIGFITVLDSQPVVDFNSTTTTIFEWDTVQFFYLGAGGDTPINFQWDFGDGSGNDTVQDPVHQYTHDGTYTVTLTVIDDDGSTVTCQKASYLTVLNTSPLVTIIVNATVVHVGETIAFNCSWTGGNGPFNISWPGASSLHTVLINITFWIPGTITINCTVIDADGDIASAQIVITVETNDTGNDPPGFTWDIRITIVIVIGAGFAMIGTGFTIRRVKIKKQQRNPDFD